MAADSMGALNNTLKKMDTEAQERAELDHQRNVEMQEKEAAAKQKEIQMENNHEMQIVESKNRNNLMTAEIKAAGYGAQQDIDQNLQSDFVDVLNDLKETERYQDSMEFDRSKEETKTTLANRKLDIEESKVATSKEIADNALRVARENTSASEIKAKKNDTKKK